MPVQVSRVDLDGRKIDFRLVREGEELAQRSGKDKPASGGTPAKASDKKRAARKAAQAPTPGERERSPIQALKAAVKKAASRGKGKPKKNRR